MVRATWKDAVLAESDQTVVVEGNHYFPPESIDRRYFKPSEHETTCPWKGQAHYYHVEVEGERNENAAWFYVEPKPAAASIKGQVAFWKGVTVEE